MMPSEAKADRSRSLRIGRARNPDSQLLRLEFFDLRRPPGRQFLLFQIDIFRLQALFACFQTPPAGVSKKPEPVAQGFACSCLLSRFTQSRMKNLLCFRGIRQHQKAKAIKLQQVLFFFGHPAFSGGNLTRLT